MDLKEIYPEAGWSFAKNEIFCINITFLTMQYLGQHEGVWGVVTFVTNWSVENNLSGSWLAEKGDGLNCLLFQMNHSDPSRQEGR